MIINLEYKEVNQTKSITIQTDVTQTFLEFIKHIPNISKYSISDYVINSQEEMEIVDEIFKILQSKYESPKQYQSRIFESIVGKFKDSYDKNGVIHNPIRTYVSQHEIDQLKIYDTNVAFVKNLHINITSLNLFIGYNTFDDIKVVNIDKPEISNKIVQQYFASDNSRFHVYKLDNDTVFSPINNIDKIDYDNKIIYVNSDTPILSAEDLETKINYINKTIHHDKSILSPILWWTMGR